uniref:FBD domain-containing protein n=1 Tax=Aegilops tauschii subsp. strangulata TaxID=200361 RepID=A0A453DZ28_AEGTS
MTLHVFHRVCLACPWSLSAVRLQMAENNGQLPTHGNVLSLFVVADDSYDFPEEVSLRTEIEKHMVTRFSVLELHVETLGHVFGAFAFHILGMDRISTAMQSLKVILLRSEDDEACPQNCPCEEPSNWRCQTISLTNLEKVKIEDFQGEGHELDFLKLVFRCAPMLKTMPVRLSDEVTASSDDCCKNIASEFVSI